MVLVSYYFYIYLFICFWLHQALVVVHGLSCKLSCGISTSQPGMEPASLSFLYFKIQSDSLSLLSSGHILHWFTCSVNSSILFYQLILYFLYFSPCVSAEPSSLWFHCFSACVTFTLFSVSGHLRSVNAHLNYNSWRYLDRLPSPWNALDFRHTFLT